MIKGERESVAGCVIRHCPKKPEHVWSKCQWMEVEKTEEDIEGSFSATPKVTNAFGQFKRGDITKF
jgi:hypothetical protein